MQQLSDEEKLQIQNLARKFTIRTLGDSCPRNKCFTICYPLCLHLENNGFKTFIKAGTFKDKGIKIPHFWLSLKGEKDTIIDPTIRQFDETREQFDKQDPVYFGQKRKNYDEEPHPSFKEWSEGDQETHGSYERWMRRILNNGLPELLPADMRPLQQLQQRKIDIKVLLKINLTAATILYAEREKKSGIRSEKLYRQYFDCIYKVICKYHDKKEMEELSHSLSKEFDRLLSEALKSGYWWRNWG